MAQNKKSTRSREPGQLVESHVANYFAFYIKNGWGSLNTYFAQGIKIFRKPISMNLNVQGFASN